MTTIIFNVAYTEEFPAKYEGKYQASNKPQKKDISTRCLQ
jgi:hypothetical protein